MVDKIVGELMGTLLQGSISTRRQAACSFDGKVPANGLESSRVDLIRPDDSAVSVAIRSAQAKKNRRRATVFCARC